MYRSPYRLCLSRPSTARELCRTGKGSRTLQEPQAAGSPGIRSYPLDRRHLQATVRHSFTTVDPRTNSLEERRDTMSVLKAHFTKDQVRIREELIIKYIVSLIHDSRQNPALAPHFLDYGTIDWSWPLRFVRGNHPYKGFKYYSHNAFDAVSRGEKKFKRDHIFPKKILKQMLLGMSDPNPGGVRNLMETYGEICVVTTEEDARLKKRRTGMQYAAWMEYRRQRLRPIPASRHRCSDKRPTVVSLHW